MSEPVACPTCGSMLRLPENAATVRCPKCKTMLEVSDAPAPAAPPMPFAKPTMARPARHSKPPKRGPKVELVDEEAEAQGVLDAEQKALAEKKVSQKRELAEMDREKEREEDEFTEVEVLTEWGRRSMAAMKWGVIAYAVSFLVGYLGLIGLGMFGWVFGDFTLLNSLGGLVVGLALALAFGASIAFAAGFALAIPGPPEARHLGYLGLVVAVLHLAAHAVCIIPAFAVTMESPGKLTADPGYPGAGYIYKLLGAATNLHLVMDTPTRLCASYDNPYWNLPAGVFEFVRLVFLCLLVQRYAELGKTDRGAAESSKTVVRFFGIMLVFAAFRAGTTVGFDWFPEGTMWYIGQVIHVLLFWIPSLLFGLRLYAQYQIIDGVEECLIADRVASKFDNFDAV